MWCCDIVMVVGMSMVVKLDYERFRFVLLLQEMFGLGNHSLMEFHGCLEGIRLA